MKAYIQSLKSTADQANRERAKAEAERRKTVGSILCSKPLTDQINELMRTLSPAQRSRCWSMEDLVVRLQGRYRTRPHPMNVGHALRALGWKQVRDWSREGGGKRYWYPQDTQRPRG